MEFLDKQILPPKSWEKFEDLSRALFAELWDEPLTQKNGRTGQAQHGVDVYGSPRNDPGKIFGVQCKGKNQGYDAKATIAEFDAELAKAEKFSPKLSKWIFATTAPNDAPLQKHVRTVSKKRISQGKFAVEIIGWESIVALVAQNQKTLSQFYPEHANSEAKDALKFFESCNAALSTIDDVLSNDAVSLSLIRPGIWSKTVEALASNPVIRLTGEGGSGKSGILRRLGVRHKGPVIALKDNRIAATGLQEHLAQLGIAASASSLFQELFGRDTVLCLIDGADRLLMSPRRGVVIDLLNLIAPHLVSGNCKLVTSARDFQDRDLVSDALAQCEISKIGQTIHVDNIDDEDSVTLAAAFPTFEKLLKRRDLSGQNRRLFLIRELLKQREAPTKAPTEIDLASLWASADLQDSAATARRSKALSQLGEWLTQHPGVAPGLAQFDPEGIQRLAHEGSAVIDPSCDTVLLAFDVHEDWLIARALAKRTADLAALLIAAGEPLWWLRAIRLAGQLLLERGDLEHWADVLSSLQNENRIDPAWSRNWLVASLYSENADTILPRLVEIFRRNDEKLLARLLETLVVFETRIDQEILSSPALSHLNEAQRYSAAIADAGSSVARELIPIFAQQRQPR